MQKTAIISNKSSAYIIKSHVHICVISTKYVKLKHFCTLFPSIYHPRNGEKVDIGLTTSLLISHLSLAHGNRKNQIEGLKNLLKSRKTSHIDTSNFKPYLYVEDVKSVSGVDQKQRDMIGHLP